MRSAQSSRASFRGDVSTTMHGFFCGLKVVQKDCCGPVRSQSATKIVSPFECTVIEAAWSGTNQNRTNSGIRDSEHQRNCLRGAVLA